MVVSLALYQTFTRACSTTTAVATTGTASLPLSTSRSAPAGPTSSRPRRLASPDCVEPPVYFRAEDEEATLPLTDG